MLIQREVTTGSPCKNGREQSATPSRFRGQSRESTSGNSRGDPQRQQPSPGPRELPVSDEGAGREAVLSDCQELFWSTKPRRLWFFLPSLAGFSQSPPLRRPGVSAGELGLSSVCLVFSLPEPKSGDKQEGARAAGDKEGRGRGPPKPPASALYAEEPWWLLCHPTPWLAARQLALPFFPITRG